MRQIYTKLLGGIVLCFSALSLNAQQLGFYALHQENWQILNPAAPNTVFFKPKNKLYNALNLGYRQQWIGVKGAPSNYNVHIEHMNYSASFRNLAPKIGGGLYGESAGPLLNNTLYFSYAYPLIFGSKRGSRGKQNVLYIGFNAGYLYRRINLNESSSLKFKDAIDETIITIGGTQKLFNGSFFELTPGLFYTNTESFYVGLSSPRLVNAGKLTDKLNVINSHPQVHVIAGGFNENRSFQPALWLRWQSEIDYLSVFQNNPISATLNVKSEINESLTLGAGISTGQWFHFQAGWTLGSQNGGYGVNDKAIKLQLSYDLPISKTGFNLGQTAELNFIFAF
jgi:type IX secretion system PorP/SprF family membrane protein